MRTHHLKSPDDNFLHFRFEGTRDGRKEGEFTGVYDDTVIFTVHGNLENVKSVLIPKLVVEGHSLVSRHDIGHGYEDVERKMEATIGCK